MFKAQNQRGTTSLAEYAVTIFLVIATITAMTIYIQRTLQSRMRDARHYMAKTVGDSCDEVYCGPAANLGKYVTNVGGLQATVQKMGDQYEPYYAQVASVVNNDKERSKKLAASDADAGTFMDVRVSQTRSVTTSNQAAPAYARTDDDQVLVSNRD